MVDEGTRAISKVIENIMENKFDKKRTVMELSKLEQKYGENVFVPYLFTKQEEPWTSKYLEELEMKIMAGAYSKEFIIHLAEVNDEVNERLRKRKFFFLIAGGVLAAIVLLFISFCKIF